MLHVSDRKATLFVCLRNNIEVTITISSVPLSDVISAAALESFNLLFLRSANCFNAWAFLAVSWLVLLTTCTSSATSKCISSMSATRAVRSLMISFLDKMAIACSFLIRAISWRWAMSLASSCDLAANFVLERSVVGEAATVRLWWRTELIFLMTLFLSLIADSNFFSMAFCWRAAFFWTSATCLCLRS